VSNVSEAQNEIKFNKLVKMYDPKNILHYPIEHSCEVNPSQVRDCSILKPEKTPQLAAFFYRDGGLTLTKHVEKKPLTTDFYVALGKLIQDVITLNLQQVQHRDIKLDNIVVRETSNYTDIRLIDFGLATSIRDNFYDRIYMANYVIWPLEIYLLAIEKPTLVTFKHAMDVINSRISSRKKHLDIFNLSTYMSAEQIFSGTPIYTDLDVVNITKEVARLVDEYSLGYALGEIAYRININSHKTSQDQLMANAISYLGKKLTTTNIMTRMSLEQALRYYLYYLTVKCTGFRQPIYHLVNVAITSDEKVLEKLGTTVKKIRDQLQHLKTLQQSLDGLVTEWNTGPRQYLLPDPTHAISYHIAKGHNINLLEKILRELP